MHNCNFNLEELLAPISATHPGGTDLAFAPEIDAVNRPDPSQSAATNGAGHHGTSLHSPASNALE